jgi:hypothetical protein
MAIAKCWLDAGIWAGVRVQMTGLDEKSSKPVAVGPLLVILARTQYGSKASLDRLMEARAIGDLQDKTEASSLADKILNAFEVLHQAHNFIVSVDTFWQTFKRLRDRISLPELETAWTSSDDARRRSREARNHIEHVAERITEGRAKPPMTSIDFIKKLGVFDGTKIWFGSEDYDIVEMHEAIMSVGRDVAPVLEEQLTLRASVVPPDPGWLS